MLGFTLVLCSLTRPLRSTHYPRQVNLCFISSPGLLILRLPRSYLAVWYLTAVECCTFKFTARVGYVRTHYFLRRASSFAIISSRVGIAASNESRRSRPNDTSAR